MNAVVAAACVSLFAVLAAVMWCLDCRGDGRAADAARDRHPATPALRRSPATRCKACLLPVRYENHPQGRGDAMALHVAYECESSSLIRGKADT